jgi:hypothetical protein
MLACTALYCSTALQLAAHELQPDGHVPVLGWHTGRRFVYYTTLLASILQTCNNGGAACVALHVDPLQVQPAPVATSLATSLCCCMIPQQSIDAIGLNADPSVAACCWCQSNEEGKDKIYSFFQTACQNLRYACVPTGLGQPCMQGLGDAVCLICMLGAVSFNMPAAGVQPALD